MKVNQPLQAARALLLGLSLVLSTAQADDLSLIHI